MKVEFKRVRYADLRARQQENYNFQKASGVLAEFGFSTVRLTDDWDGADFVSQHADGKTMLRVQLKPRLYFSKKYTNKDLWMCFRDARDIYLFPHDEVLAKILSTGKTMTGSKSWETDGAYSFRSVSKWMKPMIESYRLFFEDTPRKHHERLA